MTGRGREGKYNYTIEYSLCRFVRLVMVHQIQGKKIAEETIQSWNCPSDIAQSKPWLMQLHCILPFCLYHRGRDEVDVPLSNRSCLRAKWKYVTGTAGMVNRAIQPRTLLSLSWFYDASKHWYGSALGPLSVRSTKWEQQQPNKDICFTLT